MSSRSPIHPADIAAVAGRDALIDRRATETAVLLRDLLRRRATLAARARLRHAAGVCVETLLAELGQLDEEIAGLRRALRERPWTEAF